MIENILWYDENIKSSENQLYYTVMKTNLPNLNITTIEEDKTLFDNIKKFEYKAYILIINGRKFQIFIEYLLKNKINSIPITAIFTKSKNPLKENYNVNYKKYLEDQFYNPLGIFDSFFDLLDSIRNFMNQLKNEINEIKLGNTNEPSDYKDCYSFEYLDNKYKLMRK